MLTRAEFVQTHYPTARHITAGTGIFADTLLAQAIVESQGKVGKTYYPGQSLLASRYNNYFGIKASNDWSGPTVTLNTGEVIDGKKVTVPGKFRVYPNFESSARDYVRFLLVNPRYKIGGVFNAKSPQEQAYLLQSAGYATNPGYAKLLIDVMKNFAQYAQTTAIGAGAIALITFFFS